MTKILGQPCEFQVGGAAWGAVASPATHPEITSTANDWAAAAREKRELKAVGKKNKREPRATKKTTNKEKAAASEAVARLKEAKPAKKVAVAARDANSGGPGGRPAPLASRLHSIPTPFPLNLYGI